MKNYFCYFAAYVIIFTLQSTGIQLWLGMLKSKVLKKKRKKKNRLDIAQISIEQTSLQTFISKTSFPLDKQNGNLSVNLFCKIIAQLSIKA